MKLGIGSSVSLLLEVNLEYTCSHCGSVNEVSQIIVSSSSAPVTFSGEGIHNSAQDKFKSLLRDLDEGSDPDRFSKAKFNCRCKNCGNREAWAKMHFEKLDKLSMALRCVMALAVIFLLFSLSAPFGFRHILPIGLFALAAIAILVIHIYKKSRCRKMAAIIANMPPRSIPKITVPPQSGMILDKI